MKKILIIVLILFLFLSNAVSQNREQIRNDFKDYLVKENEHYISARLNDKFLILFIFHPFDRLVNILVDIDGSDYETLSKFMEEFYEFKKIEGYNFWISDDKTQVGYILWDWMNKKYYISIYWSDLIIDNINGRN